MCGIVGVLNLYEPRPVPESVIRAMLGMIRHRGPDEFGIYRDPWANLGNARLSIVDLSGGQQPICNEDGTLWIVFNGEIFNYKELRLDLEKRGHRFNTNCDTEVVLHLYEEHGPDCLNLMNGQFAISIWDTRKRRLFLARDRLGVRPLFYTIQNGQLIFGSEIKTIFAHPSVAASIDPIALAQVFTFWSTQPPTTIFKSIKSLSPGHYLVSQEGKVTIAPYWELDFSPEVGSTQSPKEYLEEFEHLLIDATLIRLRADVPVGAYLSGGLDSSTTTAIIRKHTLTQLDTFSISFADPGFDESEFQRQMANVLGTDHQVVYCTHADIGEIFPEVIWHVETPLLRTAPAPMFLLSRLVHKHQLKVVITGEGADEFLGGYDIFKETVIRHFWAKNPDSAWRPLLLRRLYPEIAGFGKSSAFLINFFKKNLEDVSNPFYSHLIRWSNGARLLRLLQNSLSVTATEMVTESIQVSEQFSRWSPLAKAQYMEIKTFLSPYLLSSQGDRVAMANSVEGRFPFLDYRVVEFCNRLPSNFKMRGLSEKWLLRQLASQLLPPDIWQRRKRPYRAPIHRSFFHEKTPDYVTELLSNNALREFGLFNPLAVTQLVRKAQSGVPLGEVDDMAIAGILSAQLLHQLFVKDFDLRRATLTTTDRVKVINGTME
jgi:asparagine synthase (glutamine-hydrolysing)